MSIFNIFKKKGSVQGQNDRDLIASNSATLEGICAIAENEEVKAELKALAQKVKYITAMVDDKAYSLDKKMSGLIGDLKIEVTKSKADEEPSAKLNGILRDIKALVAERNALV